MLNLCGWNVLVDAIALPAENTKVSFRPKRLEGYLEYHGVTGSSMKGGCGFYITNMLDFIPRSDLNFADTTHGNQYELEAEK